MIESAPMNRIKLRALRVLNVDGMRVAPGCTFKVDEKTANELLRWGDAELAAKQHFVVDSDSDPFAGRYTHR